MQANNFIFSSMHKSTSTCALSFLPKFFHIFLTKIKIKKTKKLGNNIKMVTEDAAVTPMKTSQPEQEWDINDKYLRLKKKSIRKLITLPPKYMGNLNKGIEEAIFKSSQEIYNEYEI